MTVVRSLDGSIACLLLLAVRVQAHDYWLEIEPRAVAVGDTCAVRLWVGDGLVAETERPFQRDMTTRYELYLPGEQRDLLADRADGASPVFRGTLDADQALWVMDRKFYTIESTVGQFLEFLEHEGQMERGRDYEGTDLQTPLRRRYARNNKALLRATRTRGGSRLHAAIVGQELEIRLLDDPHGLALDSTLTVQVSFRDTPLPGQRLFGWVRGLDGSVYSHTTQTDADGRAQFILDRHGLWLLRATHLRQGEAQEAADWDTYYATFSFTFP